MASVLGNNNDVLNLHYIYYLFYMANLKGINFQSSGSCLIFKQVAAIIRVDIG